ncbi:hypothetical protein [Rhizobium sp.]|uniref:hypothetical protein n=1 Tax=Rhizobium sp. TaxID=391 RepID=UPI0034C5EA3B
MTIAAEPRIVKQRMDEFIWREKAPAAKRLRGLLKDHFLKFDRVAIIGGMVRDFARVGKTGFRSDVDLVIDAPVEAVTDFASRFGAKPNTFGGYSSQIADWKIDFWAMETTWASREGYVDVKSLEDVTRCTFFDWDAILYDVRARQVVCSDIYLELVRSKRLEISLLPNPSAIGNLYRAVRRLLLWDLEPGPKLSDFIALHLNAQTFEAIVREDYKRSVAPFLHRFKDVSDLQGAVNNSDRRRRLSTFYAKQLPLPGIFEYTEDR